MTLGLMACSLLLADDLKSGPTIVIVERDGAPSDGPPADTSVPPADASRDAPVDESLVAWWPFDELAGLTATDVTGHGHTAFLTNAKFTQDGTHTKGAVRFSGGGEVTTPSLDAVSFPKTGTFSVWFNYSSMVVDDHVGILDLYATERSHIFIRHANGSDIGRFQYGLQTPSSQFVFSTGFTVEALAWAHVVVTWDENARAARCYLNGTLVEAGAYDGAFAPTEQAFRMGVNLKGTIDEVKLFNRPLTDAEILALP